MDAESGTGRDGDVAARSWRLPLADGRALADLTIEGVARVDDERILVVNDNNLPFSAGRTKGHPDATEVALIRAPELLKAR